MLKQIYKFLNPKFQNLFLEYRVDLQPRYGHGKPPHQQLYSIINSHREDYKNLLGKFLNYTDAIQNIKKVERERMGENPVWNNGFLPGLDIIGIYSMLAIFKPLTYIEIGSGNSTKVARKAIRDNGLSTKIVSIDPSPRAEIDELSDEVIRQPLENIKYDFVDNLDENDIVFIDNSHRVLPNSDATVFFLEILPRIPKNVLVHIHDIYLPYDYPQFMCNWFYSEQYLLAAYLIANESKYSPVMPNYFVSEDKELREIIAPIWNHSNLEGVEKHGGSFWLRKVDSTKINS